MEGGTTFHFVTDGIHAALARATTPRADRTCASAAASRRSGSTCSAGLIDEMHLAMPPVLLGAGEPLLAGIDLRALGYECVRARGGRAGDARLRAEAHLSAASMAHG